MMCRLILLGATFGIPRTSPIRAGVTLGKVLTGRLCYVMTLVSVSMSVVSVISRCRESD